MNEQEGKDACEYGSLPVDYLINYSLLFGSGATEVDTRGFDTFMSHKVGEEGEVIESFEKVLGEAVTE